jgi:hypothetical protein
MPPNQPAPLSRSNYLSWPPGPYQANADPNNSAFNPSSVIPAGGVPNYGDMALDAEQYHRPLERLHGSGLHGGGVAFGMQIACKAGAPNITIVPGLCLDQGGKHIFLAVGGQAEIGPNANVPGTPPMLAPVSISGVTLPTAGYTGDYFVVAQWWETWASSTYTSDPNIGVYNDTPWLQLVQAAGYLPDVHVILGKVSLDGVSNVTAASYGDVGGLQRTSVSVPAQSLKLSRAVTTAAPGADSVAWGELRAREAGGIELAVANNGDQVQIVTDAGGSFASFAVGANQAKFGDLGNPGVTLDAAEATVRVGAPGNYGDVLVYDGNNNLAVSLIGDTAHVIVGGATLPGKVRMLNGERQDTMALDGNTGSAVVQRLQAFANNTIDVDTTFFKIHGWDLWLDGRSGSNTPHRALVDAGNQLIINFAGDYGNGVVVNSDFQVDGILRDGSSTPLMGNPARKVAITPLMFAGVGNTNTRVYSSLTLPNPTQFMAFCLVTIINTTQNWDLTDGISAEVWMVDGVKQPWIWYNNGEWGPPGDDLNARPGVVSGFGQSITFRLTGLGDDLQTCGYGIVFYE